MNWLDIVILLPILYGLIRGLMHGLVTELIAILAVVFGVIGARIWGPDLAINLHNIFEISSTISDAIAYSVVFLAITIIANILGKLFTKLLKAIHLGWINRLLGGIFGAAKWTIIILVLVFINARLDEQFHYMKNDIKNSSMCYKPATKSANRVFNYIKSSSIVNQ